MSKVFSFSLDIDFGIFPPVTKKIIKGSYGYDIKENLCQEIEHIMPDYSIYYKSLPQVN